MISHNSVFVEPEIQSAVLNALADGRLSLESDVYDFERKFEEFFDLEEFSCIAVSSGSVALFLLLLALDVGSNSISIPLYTCASLTKAAILAKYKVTYRDSISRSLPLFSSSEKLSTVTLLPHMCGLESPFHPVSSSICIEDPTQILGSRNINGYAGFTSGLSVISFYATKSLTTLGQGGMIYVRDYNLRSIIRNLISSDSNFNNMGINLRMQGLNAIAGSIALNFLHHRILRKKDIHDSYISQKVPIIKYPEYQLNPNYYRCLIHLPNLAKEMVSSLNEHDIKAILPYESCELATEVESCENTRSLTKGLVSLPAYHNLSFENIKHTSFVVNNVLDLLK